jgi:predicted nucleic acid-binding protein
VLANANSTPTYVFDVGVIALSHADTPVSEPAFEYIKDAIRGDIIGIIPNTALLGAHHVLRNNYHIKRDVAADLLRNLQTATAINWYESVSSDSVTTALREAGRENIEAWDTYYAKVTEETGADKILTLDDDFDRVGVDFEVVLNEEEFEILLEFMENLDGIRAYPDLELEYV